MITLETVVGFAIRNPVVMDQLGEALRSDIVTANPFYRRIVEFADDFLMQKHSLPGHGDWETWLNSLEAGMLRDGTKEALGRVMSVDVSGHNPEFFAENVIEDLQQVAVQIARARMNETPALEPSTLITLAEKVSSIRSGALQGLARLGDVDVWSRPVADEEYIGTGYPTLNRLIGGWGKELWMIFADSGVGKSLLLQNFSANAAVHGINVLHITLELGLRAQIHRYYRQIAQATRADFVQKETEVKAALQHWFRLAKGDVFLLEYAAYSFDLDQLKRVVDRVNRLLQASGRDRKVDLLVLDYIDLMSPTRRNSKGGAYEDLGHLTHGVRSLCPLFDLSVLTASQAVRRPASASRLTMRDMGDSYNKVRGADGLISLVQTPDEEEVHQGRLGLLKVRDSGGRGQEIAVYINRDLSLIQELDHPNTVQLMQRLGHLPVVPAPHGMVVTA